MIEKADQGARMGFAIFCLICAVILFIVMAEMGMMVVQGECTMNDATCMDRAFNNVAGWGGMEIEK